MGLLRCTFAKNRTCTVNCPKYISYFDIFIRLQAAEVTGIRDRETFASNRLYFVRTLYDRHSGLVMIDTDLTHCILYIVSHQVAMYKDN
jgi:hypothetical protein